MTGPTRVRIAITTGNGAEGFFSRQLEAIHQLGMSFDPTGCVWVRWEHADDLPHLAHAVTAAARVCRDFGATLTVTPMPEQDTASSTT